MLEPKERTLLLESLRPPEGFRLNAVVATTFSLDLVALLVTPLTFTFYDWEGDDGQPTKDSNALLEAIRRHSNRIHVFCQAGQISVPKTHRLLFSYLESSVHEVRAVRDRGVFHPKIWIVRYVADDKSARYRLLCASRNLTFDRSWDTLLLLDGVVGERHKENYTPLSQFIRSLQEMAVRELPTDTKEILAELANEITYVEFDLPNHVEHIKFWTFGLPGQTDVWPFPKSADRALIISPFISKSILNKLNISSNQTLISRFDGLESMNADQIKNYETYIFSGGTDIEPEEDVEAKNGANNDTGLSGLHAKLFVFDISGIGYVWTGSANATDAAFKRNVEFLVELQGESKQIGVEAILRDPEKGISVLRDLLELFNPTVDADDVSTQQALDQLLLDIRRFVVDLEFELQAEQFDENLFNLRLKPTKNPKLSNEKFDLVCWPITLNQDLAAQRLTPDGEWSSFFQSLSFEALTTFFAFEARVSTDGRSDRCRFVLNLVSFGFPEDRRQRLLQHLLKDRQQLLRYLFLLLEEDEALLLSNYPTSLSNVGSSVDGGFQANFPLFEVLVKALEHSPEKLDHVERLVADLMSTEEGRELLPEEFNQIWIPLWKARKELSKANG